MAITTALIGLLAVMGTVDAAAIPDKRFLFNYGSTCTIQPASADLSYSYAGCYFDPLGSVLSGLQCYDDAKMTPDKCIARCKAGGFDTAGLTTPLLGFGASKCWCAPANFFNLNRVSDSTCTKPCSGASNLACGGALTNILVYKKDVGRYSSALAASSSTSASLAQYSASTSAAAYSKSSSAAAYSASTSAAAQASASAYSAAQSAAAYSKSSSLAGYSASVSAAGAAQSAAAYSASVSSASAAQSAAAYSASVSAAGAAQSAAAYSASVSAASAAQSAAAYSASVSAAGAAQSAAAYSASVSAASAAQSAAAYSASVSAAGAAQSAAAYSASVSAASAAQSAAVYSASVSAAAQSASAYSASASAATQSASAYSASISAYSASLSAYSASSAAPSPSPSVTPSGPNLPAGWTVASSCIQEVAGRALTGARLDDPNLTPAVCANFCASRGFKYAGVEWYTECYCGDSLVNGASTDLVSGQCNRACGGDATQTCGGANAIQLYYNPNVVAASPSPSPSVAPSPSASVAPPAPTAPASINGLANKGCIKEVSGRALTGDSLANDNMTLQVCGDYCTGKGFSMFGVEYGRECYCGNSFSNGGSADLISGQCNMPCAGNSAQLCGGPNAINLYSA